MEPEFEIRLIDVMLYARHGVMPQERDLGNQYKVNVRVRIPAADFDESADDIDSTISYADLYDMLSGIMSQPCALLESVAVRFAKKVRESWPQIKGGEIEIVKVVPPISGMIGQASVSYKF